MNHKKRNDKMFKRRHDWNQDNEVKKHRTNEFIPYTKPEQMSSETKVPKERIGRTYTTSVAIPGSILLNCATLKLKTQVVGAIARAAAIFNVDEIIVYDEYCSGKIGNNRESEGDGDNQEHVDNQVRCVHLMAKILEYLECPQYLRKTLFPLHADLQFAGLLNPLASTHHLTNQDYDIPFREGVVNSRFKSNSSLVYVGLDTEVIVDRVIQENVRVTVQLDCDDLRILAMKSDRDKNGSNKYNKFQKSKPLRGKIVSPSEPRTKSGLYWGYTVRIAASLFDVLNTCPFDDGYDLKIGTSENGTSVDVTGPEMTSKNFKHALIVFGGLKGLESVFESDTKSQNSVDNVSELFDNYINVCPNQGSNTIRTEEAILVALSAFRPYLFKHMRL